MSLAPCTDWITGDDVAACCQVEDATDSSIFDAVAVEAQEVLFALSGRQFAGECEQTVRPCRTRTCFDGFQVLSRGHLVYPYGWYGSYWNWPNGVPCGCRHLSRVKLAGYPVRDIVEVLIDGAVVDPATYRLDRKRDLVRVRDPAAPDVVLRWPACQALDLDDTQAGTWSVTYTYGADPPEIGVAAAAQLACELYKECAGRQCALPSGTTRVIRQGVTIEKQAFAVWAFQSGTSRGIPRGWRTGMPLVDAFLNSANPAGLTRRPIFWSPASTLQYPLPVEPASGS